jgi:hypothetical protein
MRWSSRITINFLTIVAMFVRNLLIVALFARGAVLSAAVPLAVIVGQRYLGHFGFLLVSVLGVLVSSAWKNYAANSRNRYRADIHGQCPFQSAVVAPTNPTMGCDAQSGVTLIRNCGGGFVCDAGVRTFLCVSPPQSDSE